MYGNEIRIEVTLRYLQGFIEVVPKKVLETPALLLSPYTPHLAEELWSMLGHEPSIANVCWPKYDEALCVEDTMEMVVQINGKLRSRIMMSKSASKEEMLEAAKNQQYERAAYLRDLIMEIDSEYLKNNK